MDAGLRAARWVVHLSLGIGLTALALMQAEARTRAEAEAPAPAASEPPRATATAPLSAPSAPSAPLLRQLQGGLLQVAADPRDQGGWGTALRVEAGLAVTNCHVVGQARELSILTGARRPPPPPATSAPGQGPGAGPQAADTGPLRVPVLAADRLHDLCLFEVPPGPVAPRRGTASVLPGEAVLATGFAGGRPGFSTGRIERRFPFDGGQVLQTGARFSAGASGGGLFDADGRLVGVLSFYRPAVGGGLHYALPSEWIEALLARWHRGGAAAAATDGPPFWDRPDEDPATPDFMRALRLEAGGDWPALERFSGLWRQRAPDDPAAAEMQQRARQQLGADAASAPAAPPVSGPGSTGPAASSATSSAASSTAGSRVRLVSRLDERCQVDGAQMVAVQLDPAVGPALEVWVERWSLGRRTADRTRHRLETDRPRADLGCSLNVAGGQHWEIVEIRAPGGAAPAAR